MGLRWQTLLLCVGITIMLNANCCSAKARIAKAPAKILAQRAGAAHYEEKYEKIDSKESSEHHLRKRASDEDFDYEVYQGVVGRPGIDFPILPRIPQTTFSCRTFGNGYFADLETECQVFHICDDGRKISFLCPNGTIFQQSELICDWWFKVNCPASPGHYAESSEILYKAQNRKPKPPIDNKNEFQSEREGYSRPRNGNKNRYPVKNNRKYEERLNGEDPSLENFDFEDITEVSPRRYEGKGGKIVQGGGDSNDAEMQVFAESASFVGNGQRRNGYNSDTRNGGKSSSSGGKDSRTDRNRPKSDRGGQRFDGGAAVKSSGRQPEFSSQEARDIGRKGGNGRQSDRKRPEGSGEAGSGTASQNTERNSARGGSSGGRDRASTYTTARRLDNSRSTPYYTPTVPTVRATPAVPTDGFDQESYTTPNPNLLGSSGLKEGRGGGQLTGSSKDTAGKGGLGFGGRIDFGGGLDGNAGDLPEVKIGFQPVGGNAKGAKSLDGGLDSTRKNSNEASGEGGFGSSYDGGSSSKTSAGGGAKSGSDATSSGIGGSGAVKGGSKSGSQSGINFATDSSGNFNTGIGVSGGLSTGSGSDFNGNSLGDSGIRDGGSSTGLGANSGVKGSVTVLNSPSGTGSGFAGTGSGINGDSGFEGRAGGSKGGVKSLTIVQSGGAASASVTSGNGGASDSGSGDGSGQRGSGTGVQGQSGKGNSQLGGNGNAGSGAGVGLSLGDNQTGGSDGSGNIQGGIGATANIGGGGSISGSSSTNTGAGKQSSTGNAGAGTSGQGSPNAGLDGQVNGSNTGFGTSVSNGGTGGQGNVGNAGSGASGQTTGDVTTGGQSNAGLGTSGSNVGIGAQGNTGNAGIKTSGQAGAGGQLNIGFGAGGSSNGVGGQTNIGNAGSGSSGSSGNRGQATAGNAGFGISGQSNVGNVGFGPSGSSTGGSGSNAAVGAGGSGTSGQLSASTGGGGQAGNAVFGTSGQSNAGNAVGGAGGSLISGGGDGSNNGKADASTSGSTSGVGGQSSAGNAGLGNSGSNAGIGDHSNAGNTGFGASGSTTGAEIQSNTGKSNLETSGHLSTAGAGSQASAGSRGFDISGKSNTDNPASGISERISNTGIENQSNAGSTAITGSGQATAGAQLNRDSAVLATSGSPSLNAGLQSKSNIGNAGAASSDIKSGFAVSSSSAATIPPSNTGKPSSGDGSISGSSQVKSSTPDNSQGYIYNPPSGNKDGSKSLKDLSSGDDSKSPFSIDGTASASADGDTSGLNLSGSRSSASSSPKPLVIGMRGTLATDTASDTIPQLTSNILSDGTFGSRKGIGQSSANSLSADTSDLIKSTTTKPFSSSSGPTYLPKESTTHHPSSSGPTYLPTVSPSGSSDSVSEHVKDMIVSLNKLKGDLQGDGYTKSPARPGLDIPPSSGPDTLHSLALYFAGEDNSTDSSIGEGGSSGSSDGSDAGGKSDINLLRNKTVESYESLFGLTTTESSTEPTLSADFRPNFATESNDLDAQHSRNLLGDPGSDTRKIVQVFTKGLENYLENPEDFRKTLSEVRPTEPPGSSGSNKVTTLNPFFNKGTAASYLPTAPTTIIPSTTTEDLEVLDFSDVTISSDRKDSSEKDGSVTSKNSLKTVDRVSVKAGKSLDDTPTTEGNDIAFEINKGLEFSTIANTISGGEHRLSLDLEAPGFSQSTTLQPEATTFRPSNSLSLLNLLPPVGAKPKDFELPSFDILPPGFEENEETLQGAHSQSIIPPRNQLSGGAGGKSSQSATTKMPGFYITRLMSDYTTESPEGTSIENPWTSSAFLDPLTINDGLMHEFRTTTASPYTYLPKGVTITTTESSPIHIDLSTALDNMRLDADGKDDGEDDRTGKAFADIPYELLPPQSGMQRIANKMFGGLNETSADHLMSVMKKAEDNNTVRRLILLLIQTCDDDYSKTFEQSRQALLNALIGMDERLNSDDEIEVIRYKPNRRGKSINTSNEGPNSLPSSTTAIPITTYRGLPVKVSTTTASPASTTDASYSTTTNPLEDTTRFEIRVEDFDESTSTTADPDSKLSTTTTSETTSFNPTDVPTTTPSPAGKSGSRRKAKDLEGTLSQIDLNSSDSSHKNSDERALELLKSLYSLASKFGRR